MRTPVRSFRELVVWQRGMDLLMAVHGVTMSLPETLRFGLSSQLRRAAVSIPVSIAEGHCRTSTSDATDALRVAAGALSELQALLADCSRLGYGTFAVEAAQTIGEEVGSMLSSKFGGDG